MRVMFPCESQEEVDRIMEAISSLAGVYAMGHTTNGTILRNYIDVEYEDENRESFFEALRSIGITKDDFIERLSDYIGLLIETTKD